MSRKVYAVILCAGAGSRMKSDRNKIFMEVGGVTVLGRVARAFGNHPLTDELIFVAKEEEKEEIKSFLASQRYLKPWKVVVGGADRQSSVANALLSIDEMGGENEDLVIIHDGARPFVKAGVIEDAVMSLENYDGVCAGVPTKDTLKIVGDDGVAIETPDRKKYWNIQTPQGFKLGVFKNAIKKATQENFVGTDDTSLVERAGVKVKVIIGCYSNIKITTKEDLAYAEAILKMEEGEG